MFYLLLIHTSKSICRIKSVVKFCQYGYFGVGDAKVNFVPWTISDLSLSVILIKHSWLFDIISGIIWLSQWQTILHCNGISHWLSPCPEWSSASQVFNYQFPVQCIRADSRFAPSQWETALLRNDVSHWLGANLESALGAANAIVMFSKLPRVF